MEKFKKLVERWESPLFVSLIIEGFQKQFNSTLGLNCNVKNYKFEAGVHFIGSNDFSRITKALEKAATQNDSFWESYIKKCKQVGNDLLETADLLAGQTNKLHVQKDFFDSYTSFTQATTRMTPYLISTVLLENVLVTQLNKVLLQQPAIKKDRDLKAPIIAELRASAAPNEPIQEMRACGRFAREINKDHKIKSAISKMEPKEFLNWLKEREHSLWHQIQQHVHDFAWITTHGYLHEPMKDADLIQRIIALFKHKEIPNTLGTRERKQLSTILKEEPLPELKKMANILSDLIALRFFRINIHLQAYTRARPFFSALANMLKINDKQIVFCTNSEILSGINTGKLPDQDELIGREKNGFSIELENGKQITRTLQKYLEHKSNQVPVILTGETGHCGTADGILRIINSTLDCNRLKHNEILVTSMTTPDFVSALEKCGAIVTNEGGILCHAAVVSRELNIPSVIGTTDATLRLQDGEKLDVTAVRDGGVITNRIKPEFSVGIRLIKELNLQLYDRLKLGQIVGEIRENLLGTFIDIGYSAGEFGLPKEKSNEGKAHQADVTNQAQNVLLNKPEYFLTYWGWRVTPQLLPERSAAWSKLTVRSIAGRFNGTKWISEQVEMDETHEIVRYLSLRYTVRAGQILTLVIRNIEPDEHETANICRDIINRLAWQFINLCNLPKEHRDNPFVGDSWRRNLDGERIPSLYTSSYAYGFLQSLCSDINSDIIINHSEFKQQAKNITQRLEIYLVNSWKNQKWQDADRVDWPMKASLIAAELLSTTKHSNSFKEALLSINNLVLPDGQIRPAPDDMKQECSELSLKIRVARALIASPTPTNSQVSNLSKLVRQIIHKEIKWETLYTHDLAFLYSIAECILLNSHSEQLLKMSGQILNSQNPTSVTPDLPELGVIKSDLFDVFLSHNSKDKESVIEIGVALKKLGLRVWLDIWELKPGDLWQDSLEKIIVSARSVLVLIGSDGIGPWELPEMRACINEFIRRRMPVIPVLLPGKYAAPELPLFLKQFQLVDLRNDCDLENLWRLEWGIKGEKPSRYNS